MSLIPRHSKDCLEISQKGLFTGLILAFSLYSSSIQAADPAPPTPAPAPKKDFYLQQEAEIPSRPSMPPTLIQKAPTDIPHCERYFLYQGKRLECDSNVSKDAIRLRQVMSDVPSAVAELDAYRENREKIQLTAYTGTLGIVAMIVGILISHPPIEPGTGVILPGGYVLLSGLGIATASMIIGFSAARSNESHLNQAVQNFNSAHPDRPIELQFSTTLNF